MVAQEMFVKCAVALQNYIKDNEIPYVGNGGTLDGMDCQGLCEFLLMQAGVPKSQCSYAGSNDMWRNALTWRGTPEECMKQFGKIPEGAWLFIHSFDGGEPSHYGDNQGNAAHVGVFIGGSVAIHASASRGKVAESTFKGKTINGGWNQVGLCKHVDYGAQRQETVQEAITNQTITPPPTIAVPDFAPLWEPQYASYTWRMGDVGDGVREVQTGIQKVGYDIQVDGQFGRGTDWSVKHFQTANHLEADGVVGQNTWAMLVNRVNG